MKLIRRLISQWSAFWFAPAEHLPIEIFRAIVGIGGGFFYLFRLLDFGFFFGGSGMLPPNAVLETMPPLFMSPVQWHLLAALPAPIPLLLHITLVTLLFLIGLGLLPRRITRPATILAFVIHLAFVFRNFGIIYGPDLVITCWLFYLCIMDHSVVLRWGHPVGSAKTDGLTTMAWRMTQLHICVIYAYSGFEKARGLSWWRGDALWSVFGNGQIVSMDLGFLHMFPVVIITLTFVTLLWEVYFPVLIWSRLRPWVLLFGVAMHLGIGVLMQLKCFALMMLAPYVLFVDERTLRKFFAQILSRKDQFLVAMTTKGAYKKIWRK